MQLFFHSAEKARSQTQCIINAQQCKANVKVYLHAFQKEKLNLPERSLSRSYVLLAFWMMVVWSSFLSLFTDFFMSETNLLLFWFCLVFILFLSLVLKPTIIIFLLIFVLKNQKTGTKNKQTNLLGKGLFAPANSTLNLTFLSYFT